MVTAVDANAIYFAEFRNEEIQCRAFGHAWPIPRLGRRVPRGWRATLSGNDGSYQITVTCSICTTDRIRTTLPHGYLWDTSASYHYDYPEWWHHIPADDKKTVTDFKNEYLRRFLEDSKAAV
jgi:hypothetical protein